MTTNVLVRTRGGVMVRDTISLESVYAHRPCVVPHTAFIETRAREIAETAKQADVEILATDLPDGYTDKKFLADYAEAGLMKDPDNPIPAKEYEKRLKDLIAKITKGSKASNPSGDEDDKPADNKGQSGNKNGK